MNLLTLQHQRAQTESYLRDFKKDLRRAKIPAAGDTEQLRRMHYFLKDMRNRLGYITDGVALLLGAEVTERKHNQES